MQMKLAGIIDGEICTLIESAGKPKESGSVAAQEAIKLCNDFEKQEAVKLYNASEKRRRNGWQLPNIIPPFSCYFSETKKFLIYDYAPAGSLFALLHENEGRAKSPFDWDSRMKVARGIARGISHLHLKGGVKFIHGNIKSSNILLTQDLDGCISDYGFAPIMDFSASESHYHAPEYVRTRKATMESDVYSFGILLLEILTGIEPALFDLPLWILSIWTEEMQPKESEVSDIFDAELLWHCSDRIDEMLLLLKIDMQCLANKSDKRPKMNDVARIIEYMQACSHFTRRSPAYCLKF